MTAASDPPESPPMARKHTYGRKTARNDQQLESESTLLFQDFEQSTPKETTTLTSRDDTVDWRQRVAELDSTSEDESTEQHLADALRQLRRSGPQPLKPLAATSSLTSLSTAPLSSTPSKECDNAKTPSEEPLSLEHGPSTGDNTAVRSTGCPVERQPEDGSVHRILDYSTLDLFDGEDASSLKTQKKGPKPLSKADKQQMHKDIAQAERERPVQLSRPEQRYKPVTAWLKNASVAVQPSSSPGPGHESDDIQQFTPSSAAKQHDLQQESSGPLIPASSSPSKSSPTLQSKRAPGRFPRFDVLDDDEEEITLDGVITAAAKRKSLNARKQAALEKQRQVSRQANENDEDSLDVVLPPTRPKTVGADRQVPDALAIFNRTTSVAAPSKRQQHFAKLSGKQRTRKPLTETHAEYAAQEFGHADLKRRNAGSRPAGQKQGRDEPVQQTQVNDNLLRRHQRQANELAKQKEAKYGGARRLPPKEPLAAVQLHSASGSPADFDSDSDDEYVDQQSVASSGDPDGDLDSADEAGDTTVVGDGGGGSPNPLSQEGLPVPVPDAMSNVEEDEGDDAATPKLRKPRSRALRRVEFESEDEADDIGRAPESAHIETSFTGGASASPDLAGFGSAGGGFSQLFGETQQQQSSLQGDAFADLRNQKGAGLLPAEALLPSVNISETQAMRDKALIAGEAEAGEEGDKVLRESTEQLYLNSQGFFTQTRPADRSSPAKKSATSQSSLTMDAPMQDPASAHPSSTVLNSSSHLEASPTQATFARLRRRGSVDPVPSGGISSSTITRTNQTNAFDVLHAGARAASRKQKSNFVDEQAEESDEDNGWFFPQKGDGDDEEEDSGDEGYIKELVDDAALSTEEERRLAMQAAEKHREITREDDARMEAEAKKMTEGYYRRKRHGNEFMSDEEDEDGKKRKFSKKQRRQRKLDREDGLYKIGGEENKFLEAYEAGLESDVDFEETPASPTGPTSPMIQRLSAHERNEMLRSRGRANRETGAVPFQDEEDEGASKAFAIRRRQPALTLAGDSENQGEENLSLGKRSVHDLRKFLADETSNPRRAGGGVSVVQRSTGARAANAGTAARSNAKASDSRDSNRESRRLGSSNSVLMDRAKRFA